MPTPAETWKAHYDSTNKSIRARKRDFEAKAAELSKGICKITRDTTRHQEAVDAIVEFRELYTQTRDLYTLLFNDERCSNEQADEIDTAMIRLSDRFSSVNGELLQACQRLSGPAQPTEQELTAIPREFMEKVRPEVLGMSARYSSSQDGLRDS